MRFKTLVVAALMLAFAVSVFATETVTVESQGVMGDAVWTRGSIVWSAGDTFDDPETITAAQLGLGIVGAIFLTPYAETDYFAHPEILSRPKTSINITVHCAAADSTMSDPEATYTGAVNMQFFAISK